MKQITNRADIELMVDSFYSAVREDTLIGPIFNRIIKDKWPEHLETMYKFWQTVLLHEHAYKGSPFYPHRKLPLQQQHFERWLHHFSTTIDTNFEGKLADEAKWRAQKMAQMFMHKLQSGSY